jgi:3-deoxy-D-manno-octulosonic-acid transferase
MVVYNLATRIYFFVIKLFSFFNKKAALWVNGRKNWEKKLAGLVDPSLNYIWFHCASLGEFEQGRSLIEMIKKKHPKEKILLTFFSPSGYEIRKNYKQADIVFYLPQDNKKNAKNFIDLVKPKFAVFVKYEFWFHYINRLNQRKIPLFFISTIFREKQYFFKWYGKSGVNILKKVNYFFLQDQKSSELLHSINISNHTISGDTRFDRVLELKSGFEEIPIIKKFTENSFTIVAGSTWRKDEGMIENFINQEKELDIKWIIAPHNINSKEIDLLKNNLNTNTALLSQTNLTDISYSKVLLIDHVGLLSHLYYYCNLAYIGGGFGKGIHNILEATTYSKPVFFGPNFLNFKEANDLLKIDGAQTFATYEDFKKIILYHYNQSTFSIEKGVVAGRYTHTNAGATHTIFQYLKNYL